MSSDARAERPRGAATPSSVLLVDDSAADRTTIARMLVGAGVQTVEECDSAFEAYNLLKSSRFDMLLLDVIMPSIGGIKLLRAVRQTKETADLPILMMTASREVTHLNDARAAWADGYLLKPFTAGALKTMMASSLRGKGFARTDAGGQDSRETATDGAARVNRLFARR